MTARILDGIKIRDEMFAELKGEVTQMTAQGIRPGDKFAFFIETLAFADQH